jgi:hypothetical protein
MKLGSMFLDRFCLLHQHARCNPLLPIKTYHSPAGGGAV